MKNKRLTYKLNAFSVLELTVVIALMALLSGLFFAAVNRFNEQVSNDKKIKDELNHWFAVRANLWLELDAADSVQTAENSVTLFHPGKQINYTISDNRLFRQTDGEPADLGLEMNKIGREEAAGKEYLIFNISWKKEEMVLRYPLRKDLSQRINNYFLAKQWP